jgi:hypothetical protein
LTTKPPSTRWRAWRSTATSEPAPGLGDGQGGDLLAGDGGREVAALLVLGAELPHRRGGDADVRADARRQPARAAARHLLGEDRVVQVVAALPPYSSGT